MLYGLITKLEKRHNYLCTFNAHFVGPFDVGFGENSKNCTQKAYSMRHVKGGEHIH